jgi:hypothetical protein
MIQAINIINKRSLTLVPTTRFDSAVGAGGGSEVEVEAASARPGAEGSRAAPRVRREAATYVVSDERPRVILRVSRTYRIQYKYHDRCKPTYQRQVVAFLHGAASGTGLSAPRLPLTHATYVRARTRYSGTAAAARLRAPRL